MLISLLISLLISMRVGSGSATNACSLSATRPAAPRTVGSTPASAPPIERRARLALIFYGLSLVALLASIPVAHVLGWLGMPQLYAVALGMGAFSTFFEVAILSYLPGLVGRQHLVEANSRPVVLSDSAAKQRTACSSGRTAGGSR